MKITILGTPLAKQSFRVTKSGFKYQDKDVRNWSAQARQQIISQLPKNFKPFQNGVIFNDLRFYFPIQKSMPKQKQNKLKEGKTLFRSRKPDLDNCIKNFFDSCNGILFLDDSQVCGIVFLTKEYGFQPKIDFDISEIKDEDYY